MTEADVRAKLIDPAVEQAGWSEDRVQREITFTAGRIHVHGKTVSRGKKKRVDYILYYKNDLPLALIEAKDDSHSAGDGLQQGISYAQDLDIPFVYSSNGKGFIEHDSFTGAEKELDVSSLPSPEELFARFIQAKGITEETKEVVLSDYFTDGSGKKPRYYQRNAINRVVESVAKGQDRIMLVMATGTGKTYTAFQIIWRLWRTKQKKRILFLVDRTALADQTLRGEFRYGEGNLDGLRRAGRWLHRQRQDLL